MPSTLALLVLSVSPLASAAAGGRVDLGDHRAEGRYVVSIAVTEQRTVEGSAQLPLVVRIPRASLIHRFTAELVDREGKRITRRPDWAVTFLGAGHDALARLTSLFAAIEVPRPYALPMAAGDSMIVVASVPDGMEGAVLRLTMEYQEPGAGATRLPVQLLGAIPERDGWTWRPVADGRFVAMTSGGFVGAELLLIEDVESGQVVWRKPAESRGDGVTANRGEVLRFVVTVQAGRAYRVRRVGIRPGADRPPIDPVAVVFFLANG